MFEHAPSGKVYKQVGEWRLEMKQLANAQDSAIDYFQSELNRLETESDHEANAIQQKWMPLMEEVSPEKIDYMHSTKN
jgi:phage host-nuclease inhibitor protein Gam